MTISPHSMFFILLGIIAAGLAYRLLLFFRGLSQARRETEGEDR